MEYKHINSTCYTTIQGYMITELGLKGNELLIYALINGFSQDRESDFHGSLAYIQEFTSMSRQGVINTLNSLIEKGLIEKNQTTRSGVIFNSYITLPVVNYFDHMSNNLTTQSKNLTTQSNNLTQNLSNIKDNNKENYIEKESRKKEKAVNRKEIPLPFDSPRLRELWVELMDYEEWKAKSNHAIELRVKELARIAKGDVKVAIASIKQTLAKGWKDFYEPKSQEYFDKEPTPIKVRKPRWEELDFPSEEAYNDYLKMLYEKK